MSARKKKRQKKHTHENEQVKKKNSSYNDKSRKVNKRRLKELSMSTNKNTD